MATARLLVVDDDPTTRWALGAIFGRLGWDVIIAQSVAEGITALDLDPQCLILDLNLPDGSGESVLRAIRDRGLATRVAVCSGTTDASRVARVRAMEPEILLSKPYDLGPIMHLCELAKSA